MVKLLYAVVMRNGEVKRSKRSHHLMIYTTMNKAKQQCDDGDSVVLLPLDLDRAPLFIKGQVL